MNGRESNVVSWPHHTVAPMTAEKILSHAIEAGVEPLLVAGYDRDGKLVVASTHSDVPEILLLLKMAQRFLENDVFESVSGGSAA